MDRPTFVTDEMLGYMSGFARAAEIYNAGHLPEVLLRAMLAADYVLPEEPTKEAVAYWRWWKAQ